MRTITIMNKTLITIFLGILTINAMAQIEMFDESAQKIEEARALPYDSLRNIATQRYGNGDGYKFTMHHLIGQTLLYCGDPYEFFSKHSFEKGSYYRVDGILPDDPGKGLYHRLLLTNLETGIQSEEGDIFAEKKYNYRWVVVGHYEKMKSLYINKELVYVGTKDLLIDDTWHKANGLIDLETDTVTTGVPKGSVWTCIGVQVKPRKKGDRMDTDKRSPIVLIVENPTYGKHYCYLEDESGKPYKASMDEGMPLICGRFQLKTYYDNVIAITAANKAKRKAELTKRFGATNANLILEGKVRIGMTKEMCEESWGHPSRKNKTIGSWGTHEQWVYGNSYLYFEGNKLTTIQN